MTEEEFQKIDEKEDNLHYNIFVFFAILTIIKYFAFDQKIIGGDLRYTIFIFWIPFLLGLIILSIYQQKKIVFVLKSKDSIFQKCLYFSFLFIIGGTISYFSTCTVSDLIFQLVNNQKIETEKHEILNFKIESYNEDKNSRVEIIAGGNKVWFLYNNREESLKVEDKIFELIKLDPNKYTLNVELKKGVWNSAVVYDWKIQRIE